MRLLIVGLILLLPVGTVSVLKAADHKRLLIVVRGASGSDEYGRQFDLWTSRWMQAATLNGSAADSDLRVVRIGPEGNRAADSEPSDYEQLKRTLMTSNPAETDELWIVLNGHGTFDGRVARFNLHGPDVSAEELGQWIAPFSCSTAVIHCGAASGPFLTALRAPHRVIVTATKSGSEQNFARLGEFLSEAISSRESDLDKDGQASLFEAFLAAARRTDRFYETEGRLATEHALLEDTGGGNGLRADDYRGLRPIVSVDGKSRVSVVRPEAGRKAHQLHLVRSSNEQQISPEVRARRDQLELAVTSLRDRKSTFPSEDAYYRELEVLLVQLAELSTPLRTGK